MNVLDWVDGGRSFVRAMGVHANLRSPPDDHVDYEHQMCCRAEIGVTELPVLAYPATSGPWRQRLGTRASE